MDYRCGSSRSVRQVRSRGDSDVSGDVSLLRRKVSEVTVSIGRAKRPNQGHFPHLHVAHLADEPALYEEILT